MPRKRSFVKSRRKVYAIYLKAKNTPSGNPNRGWLCYYATNGFSAGFVNEGFRGRHALDEVFPNNRQISVIHVAPSEIRLAKKRRVN